jgi:predicted anti-sigma-YlaC factor YlaD
MHAVTMENLEEYLAGTLEPAQLREIEAHLSNCSMCRDEMRGMQQLAGLFVSLRDDKTESWDMAPGFAVKVMEQVAHRKPAPAFASFFALNLAFGRRLVFASLLMLAVVGGFLVTRESQYPRGSSPEAILAQQDSPGFAADGLEATAANNMLVTLTAYEH